MNDLTISDYLMLRRTVDVLYDVQDVRMRTANRLRLMPKKTKKVYVAPLVSIEDGLTKEIEGLLSRLPIYTNWLQQVRGIGPRLAGSIVAQTMIRFKRVTAAEYKKIASQYANENQVEFASHWCNETQNGIASQSFAETHLQPASHQEPENHSTIASHVPRETQGVTASQEESDTQPKDASHITSETQHQLASHGFIETQSRSAFSQEQLELAQKTDRGEYLIPVIRGIGAFDTVSKFWAWWGLHVKDGRAPKRSKGAKINWNSVLRTLAWKIGKQFVLQGERYRTVYDEYKARLSTARLPVGICPQYQECLAKMKKRAKPACKGHIDAMARRYAVKMFLSHLWEKWRTLEGLPVRAPYVIDKLGHTSKTAPVADNQSNQELPK